MPWESAVLEDLKSLAPYSLVGGPFGSELTSRDYTDAGVPVIRGNNLPKDRQFLDDDVLPVFERERVLVLAIFREEPLARLNDLLLLGHFLREPLQRLLGVLQAELEVLLDVLFREDVDRPRGAPRATDSARTPTGTRATRSTRGPLRSNGRSPAGERRRLRGARARRTCATTCSPASSLWLRSAW